jgi:hypothetical protein
MEAIPNLIAATTSDGISCWAKRMNKAAEETDNIPTDKINTGDWNHLVRTGCGLKSTLLDKGESGS